MNAHRIAIICVFSWAAAAQAAGTSDSDPTREIEASRFADLHRVSELTEPFFLMLGSQTERADTTPEVVRCTRDSLPRGFVHAWVTDVVSSYFPDLKVLAEINQFLATPSGQKVALRGAPIAVAPMTPQDAATVQKWEESEVGREYMRFVEEPSSVYLRSPLAEEMKRVVAECRSRVGLGTQVNHAN
jgi:hypothetical protein